MKIKMFLFIAVLLCGGVSVFAQKMMDGDKGMKSSSNEQVIMEKERMAWDNLKNKKYDDFAKIFSDNYQGVYSEGIMTKSEEANSAKMFDFKNVNLSNMKVVFPESNTAIVTYSVMFEGMPNGSSEMVSENLRATTVWVKRGGQWMVFLHQHTPMKQ